MKARKLSKKGFELIIELKSKNTESDLPKELLNNEHVNMASIMTHEGDIIY